MSIGSLFSFVFIFGLQHTPAQAQSSQPQPPAISPAAVNPAAENIGDEIRFKVDKFKLDNGLTVLLYEDHTIPQINYQTWFKVGSKNEEVGYTGMAHLFEHMMFKGAKRYSGDQFDSLLQSNGGINNAATTTDYTMYYESLPAGKLELLVDLESDRMENLQITEENLKTEKQVVKEERRYRVDGNPIGVLMELLYEAAYKVHPYRWPVIGYMEDIDRITLEKANDFHRVYYSPGNATITIAGDFVPDAAKALIAKYYGPIPAQTIPDKPRPQEPPQMGGRSGIVDREVQNAQFAIAYHTPKAGDDDSYALDLLANIMGYGPSSRLYQRLVYRDQIAVDVQTANYSMQDSGLFQIFVTLKAGVLPRKIQTAVLGEMWRPRNLKILDVEVQKAKNQIMKSYVDGLKSLHGKAESLEINETYFNDYTRLFSDLDHYNKITAEDIHRVAVKYLSPEKCTIVILRPKKGFRIPAKPKAWAAKSKSHGAKQ